MCDDPSEAIVGVCHKISRQFENALNEDEGNSYRLRKAFFYSPNAKPVLMRVNYLITFSENVTTSLDYCYGVGDTSNDSMVAISTNNTTLRLTYGWTSSGVFTIFHPLTLNFMQMQLPFKLLRIFSQLVSHFTSSEGGPETLTLLWDATYDLPTLNISLNIKSLPCIPSTEFKAFESALMEFNSLVSLEQSVVKYYLCPSKLSNSS